MILAKKAQCLGGLEGNKIGQFIIDRNLNGENGVVTPQNIK